jgi:hypothetical protein
MGLLKNHSTYPYSYINELGIHPLYLNLVILQPVNILFEM